MLLKDNIQRLLCYCQHQGLMPSEILILMKNHHKWVVTKLTVNSFFIDYIHIFLLYIFYLSLTTLISTHFNYFILLTFFTRPHKLY